MSADTEKGKTIVLLRTLTDKLMQGERPVVRMVLIKYLKGCYTLSKEKVDEGSQ